MGGEDYEQKLQRLILGAEAFLFVLSPRSIASKPALEELAVAVLHNKPILPLVCERPRTDLQLDSALASIHWIFPDDKDGEPFADVVRALRTDLDLTKTHSRMLLAAQDWNVAGRLNGDLMNAERLREAEAWLARVASQPQKLPQPTIIEVDYIVASQHKRRRNGRRNLLAGASIVLALTALAGVAWWQRGVAVEQRGRAEEKTIAEQRARELQEEATLVERGSRAALLAQFPGRDGNALRLAVQGAGPFWERGRTPPESVTSGVASAIVATHGSVLTAGHRGEVTSIVMSHDGKLLATGSKDGSAKVWAADTGQLRLELVDRDQSVVVIGFLADDHQVVVNSRPSGTVRTWDITTGRQVSWMGADGFTLRISPDGRAAADVAKRGTVLDKERHSTVRLWNSLTGVRLATVNNADLAATPHVFSSDGARVVIGRLTGQVEIRATATGALLKTWSAHDRPIRSSVFSPRNDIIATVSEDGFLRTWDAASGNRFATVPAGSYLFHIPSFSRDGRLLLWRATDSTLVIDSRTGGTIQSLRGSAAGGTAMFVADDKRVFAISPSYERSRSTWSVETGALLRTEEEFPSLKDPVLGGPESALVLIRGDGGARLLDPAASVDTKNRQLIDTSKPTIN